MVFWYDIWSSTSSLSKAGTEGSHTCCQASRITSTSPAAEQSQKWPTGCLVLLGSVTTSRCCESNDLDSSNEVTAIKRLLCATCCCQITLNPLPHHTPCSHSQTQVLLWTHYLDCLLYIQEGSLHLGRIENLSALGIDTGRFC